MDIRTSNPRDAATGLFRVEVYELDTGDLLLSGPKRKTVDAARRSLLRAVVGTVRHGLVHGAIPADLVGLLRSALPGPPPRRRRRTALSLPRGSRFVKVPPVTGSAPAGVA